MTKSSFEDIIAEQGKLIYTSVGDSMNPLIKEGDLLVISKVTQPLKKYDIPLYKRDNGQYVLHRIIDISSDGYVMCGDNRAAAERGIGDRNIIGVLTAVIRDGVESPVEPGTGLYTRLWYGSLMFRKIVFRVKGFIK